MNISWKGRQKWLHGTDSRTLIRILKQEEERSFHTNHGKRKVKLIGHCLAARHRAAESEPKEQRGGGGPGNAKIFQLIFIQLTVFVRHVYVYCLGQRCIYNVSFQAECHGLCK